MTKKGTTGVKPPIIGKFTGRVRTPLSIFSAFFALGVFVDIIVQAIWRFAKIDAPRVWLKVKFWFLIDDELKYTMPDGSEVPFNETIAWDDLILAFITLGILLIYKIRWRWRLIAATGFFIGWYVSSMWISGRFPWHEWIPASSSSSSRSSSTSQSPPKSEIYGMEE